MADERLQERTDKNTDDISALTANVAALTEVVKSTEKRHEESMEVVKEAVQEIAKLNDRVSSMVSLEKEFANFKEKLSEIKEDVRINKHGINDVKNAQQAIGPMNEAIHELKGEVKVIKSWKDTINGGSIVAKIVITVLWMLFGAGILAGAHFWLQAYFTRNVTTTTTTTIEKPAETTNGGLQQLPQVP